MARSGFQQDIQYDPYLYQEGLAPKPVVAKTKPDKATLQEITLPDLHGNALAAILRLEAHGILEFENSEDRKAIFEIYKGSEKLTPENFATFQEILKKRVKVHKPFALVRFIGDIFGDRGKSDALMLCVLDKLQEANVNVQILLSNHDLALIKWYLANKELRWNGLLENQRRSLSSLITFLEKYPEQKPEIDRLIKEVYFPMVNLLHSSIEDTNPPQFLLFSHAPVGIEAVRGLAKLFELKCNESTPQKLGQTIVLINRAFREELLSNPQKLVEKFLAEEKILPNNLKDTSPLTPLHYISWNRTFRYIEGLEKFLIENPHGHSGDHWPINNYRRADWVKDNIKGINLDYKNNLGYSDAKYNPEGCIGTLNTFITNVKQPSLESLKDWKASVSLSINPKSPAEEPLSPSQEASETPSLVISPSSELSSPDMLSSHNSPPTPFAATTQIEENNTSQVTHPGDEKKHQEALALCENYLEDLLDEVAGIELHGSRHLLETLQTIQQEKKGTPEGLGAKSYLILHTCVGYLKKNDIENFLKHFQDFSEIEFPESNTSPAFFSSSFKKNNDHFKAKIAELFNIPDKNLVLKK